MGSCPGDLVQIVFREVAPARLGLRREVSIPESCRLARGSEQVAKALAKVFGAAPSRMFADKGLSAVGSILRLVRPQQPAEEQPASEQGAAATGGGEVPSRRLRADPIRTARGFLRRPTGEG